MALQTTDVCEVVQAVATSMLGEEAILEEGVPTVTPELAACVAIHGEWEGVVMVACSQKDARQIAMQMMQVDESDMTIADAHDAIGEISNMIGGNLKSLLVTESGSCHISLPMVSMMPITVVGWRTCQHLWFALGRSRLRISVLSDRAEKRRAPGAVG